MTNCTSEAALVSVVIPTYNRPAYLKKAVESVVQQTYQNLDIIVCDDCSPKSPQTLLDSFQDDRIRLLRHPHNLGNGPNVAQGFKLARGKYVASLNDDDYWHPKFVETLVRPLEFNPDLNFAFCDHYIVDAEGTVDQAATEESSKRWRRDCLAPGIHRPCIEQALVHQSVSPASSALLRQAAITWDELLPVGVYWDYFLAYLGCRDGFGAYYCPKRLTYYRIHSQSETSLSGGKDASAKIRKGKSGIYCYGQFLADPKLEMFASYFRQKWIEANTTLAIGLIKSGASTEARPYLRLALRHGLNLRSTAAFLLSFLPKKTVRLLIG
jgi:glycosyltransferase involved in cell wall biosynthesis